MNVTSLDDVLSVVVAAATAALSPVPVFDGTPISWPSDLAFVVIGGGIPGQENDEADTSQRWNGLGLKTRLEEVRIQCSAFGRASRVPAARVLALAAVESVGNALPIKPTSTTYNALVSGVDRLSDLPTQQSGIFVRAQFSIRINARNL